LKLSKTDTEAPKRQKLLRDNEEPRLVTSITDSENSEPNLATPNTDNEHPSRTTLLSDSEEPRCEQSNTERALPKRAKLRIENDDAR